MGAHLHLNDVLLQQGRQYGTRYTLILHEVFKHRVVDWIGNGNHSFTLIYARCKDKKKNPNRQAIRRIYAICIPFGQDIMGVDMIFFWICLLIGKYFIFLHPKMALLSLRTLNYLEQ